MPSSKSLMPVALLTAIGAETRVRFRVLARPCSKWSLIYLIASSVWRSESSGSELAGFSVAAVF